MLWKITIITNLLLAVWRHGPEEGIFLDIISIELLNFIPSPVSDTDLLLENCPSFGNGCVLWSRLQDLVRNVPESDSSYMTNKSKKNLHNFVIYLTGNQVFLTAWYLCKCKYQAIKYNNIIQRFLYWRIWSQMQRQELKCCPNPVSVTFW